MRTIRDYVNHWAEKQPNKPYLKAPEPELQATFQELQENSVRLARFLNARNIQKGDKVSFMCPNGYQTTLLFLGIMYGGFTVSPINIAAQMSHLEYILEHSETKLVFASREYEEKVRQALQNIQRDVELIALDVDSKDILPDDKELPDFTLPEMTEEDDALLLYTSGTTGLPKGALMSNKNVVAGGMNTIEAHELTSEDIAYCVLTLTHINGEIVSAVAPMVSGSTVVMPHRFSVSNFWEHISKYKCTWFSVVPTIISYVYHSTDPFAEGYDLSHLKFGRSASSPLPESLHRNFEERFNIPIIETMGFTEAAAPGFSNLMHKRKTGSPGKPIGNEAKIVDRTTRESLPPGQEGEIAIRGDNIMKGYFKAPDKTRESMDDEGWYYTGDLAKMDEDGFIYVTGRLKELIIKGGENIAPREIDDVLYEHPAVVDGAAFSVPDENYGENIEAAVTIGEGESVSEEDLIQFCRDKLGKAKTPKKIHFIEEMPKGPSGKIQRFKLPEMLASQGN